jgi:hypothetical protein
VRVSLCDEALLFLEEPPDQGVDHLMGHVGEEDLLVSNCQLREELEQLGCQKGTKLLVLRDHFKQF